MNNIREPGAQPGNRNAYKHGFYSKTFSTLEGKTLNYDTGLKGKLNTAHIIAERIFNRLNGHGLGLDDSGQIDEATIRAINTLANVYGSISTLARKIQRNPFNLAQYGSGITLRPSQLEPTDAILHSILDHAGRTIVIIISRQSGKDELLTHLILFLLQHFQEKDKEIVEFNPTYKPQTIRSIFRLENRMQSNVITRNRWNKRSDFMRMIGQAKVSFLSGDGQANVVGATASLLVIINEAQDISTSKYDRDAAPMAASTNATQVIVGTSWTSNSLLARELRAARLAQETDGIRRVFIYDVDEVRKHNPPYGKFVDGEVTRLGRNHPFIRTQYYCEETDAQIGMFNAVRRAFMQGDQSPQARPMKGLFMPFCWMWPGRMKPACLPGMMPRSATRVETASA